MNSSPTAHWKPHFALGITGHRINNASLTANIADVEAVLASLFDTIEGLRQEVGEASAKVRLHSLLANGVDQMAAQAALERDWELVAPLPFGKALNCAINAEAETLNDFRALCDGKPAGDVQVNARAQAIRALEDKATTFAIADRDEEIRGYAEAMLADPSDTKASSHFAALTSINAALAGRVMLERSDLLIAVWDGATTDLSGGTGHTILTALEIGTPVLVIDPASARDWAILTRPEELAHRSASRGEAEKTQRLRALMEYALASVTEERSHIERERWRPKPRFGLGLYRWIEGFFGGRSAKSGTMAAAYEAPDAIASGSAAPVLEAVRLATGEPEGAAASTGVYSNLRDHLFPTFAWADGVSNRLADAYRSGMALNFALSALAIIAGVAYLPLGLATYKWIFASIELLLLVAILAITYAGYRRAWHRRWFETRRLAEYLRFAPGLILMGVARPVGRWPRGESREWPEPFARDTLRDAGLPDVTLDRDYLRTVLSKVILPHVAGQRRYHEAKSGQLHTVHHRLDKAAETCFLAAIVSVSVYLALEIGALIGAIPPGWPYAVAKAFTFLGVAFPTLGANLAGLRYFGDFERFSAISQVTATQLKEIEKRIELLLSGDPKRLTYGAATDLVRAIEDVIVSEIESWQAVFGGKHLSLPA
ncbi:MAG: hypothetical protein WBA51_16275 [Erythrobacter sp.]